MGFLSYIVYDDKLYFRGTMLLVLCKWVTTVLVVL